ncbi:MAG: aldehyde dehydrogenase [Alistipes sp.]|nr:aldehyde dehydrogenase [Alistipes sp.]
MTDRYPITDAFAGLGPVLANLPEELVTRACQDNGWFTSADIRRSANAIASEFTDRDKLRSWADRYPFAATPKNVMVVMAGNIPMAGFFDLLCVSMSGHNCIPKFSSKDTVLMEYLMADLLERCPGIGIILPPDSPTPDAVIASGSDNTVRHLKYRFGSLPALYRGNRTSAAILSGNETTEELSALARDIFSYSGLGCRNVSHLFLPPGYDTDKLSGLLSGYPLPSVNPKYLNNYSQRKAVLELSGAGYTDGRFFLLTASRDLPAAISEITYEFYISPAEAGRRVGEMEDQLQCIVAGPAWNDYLPFPSVPFGKAQSPTLYDFPDRVDTMRFLSGL